MQGRPLTELAELGLAPDNMHRKGENLVTGEFSQEEIGLLTEAGFLFDVLIDDVSDWYRQRNKGIDQQQIEKLMREPKPGRRWQTPANFSLGSMGGFHTHDELMQELDAMRALYPQLISEKAPISDSLLSIEGRPVYFLRISSQPDIRQDDKPRVLYTALTHAREPASMQQMLFQMWYLLENYGIDAEITYLIENLEMYFVPLVNPDGYIYNQQISPNGGGMHRKNRRMTSSSPHLAGVDLNRNFGYMWGYDNSGSSPLPTSNTYRGEAPFSEPETRMLKYFAEDYNFSLALNNHTYSDLLIYPWGYANLLTPDSLIFIQYASLMTRENNYVYGTCYETLNYFANGGSDDWFYGEQQTKNKVFAFTPEAGSPSDGFWPQIHRIEDICAGHTGMNLYLARLALPYAEAVLDLPQNDTTHHISVPFLLSRYGQGQEPVSYQVSVNPLSQLIIDHSEPLLIEGLQVLDQVRDTLFIELNQQISQGMAYSFEFVLDNGQFAWRDTLHRVFGVPDTLLFDRFETDARWQFQEWGLDQGLYFSEPASLADSPGGQYQNNADNWAMLTQAIDLSQYSAASLGFRLRWDIERNYDFAQIQVSADEGENWHALSGQFTEIAPSGPGAGQPVYHGTQSQWVQENISLDEWHGQSIHLRFRFKSDFTVTRQGIYIDDLVITAVDSYLPQPPQITSQQVLQMPMEESFELLYEHIQVDDPHYSYPADHELLLGESPDAHIEGRLIQPVAGFSGMLEIPLKVSNGLLESNAWMLQIEVLDVTSAPDTNSESALSGDALVAYHSEQKRLKVSLPEDAPAGNYLLQLYSLDGRLIDKQSFFWQGSQAVINSPLKSSWYSYRISGERQFSGLFFAR